MRKMIRILCCVCLFSVAVLLTAQVQADVITQALFRFGEDGSSGGDALLPLDSSGNNRHVTGYWGSPTTSIVSGGPSLWPTSTLHYQFGGGIGYGRSYSAPTDNVGIEVWARVDPSAPNAAMFGTGWFSGYLWNGYSRGLNIIFEDGQFKGILGTGDGATNFTFVGTPVAPTDASTWYHLALVRDNGVATFYVNGLASGATSSTVPVSSGDFAMSIASGGGWRFTGGMDEARIFTFNPGEFRTSDLQIVPEPSALVLAGVGLLGLLAWPWRRRR